MTISKSFEAVLPLSPEVLMTAMTDLRIYLSMLTFNEVYVKSVNKVQDNEGEIELVIGDTVNKLNVKLKSEKSGEARVVELEGRGDIYFSLRISMSARDVLTLVRGELVVKASYFKERRIEGALDKFVRNLRMKIIYELPVVIKPLENRVREASPKEVKAEKKITTHLLKVSEILGIDPEDLPKYMLVKTGDKVRRGDVIAKYVGMSGLLKREVISPADGVIESINEKTGSVVIAEQTVEEVEERPRPVETPVQPAPKPTPPEEIKRKESEVEVYGDPRGLEDDVRLSLILLKSQLIASTKKEVDGKDIIPTFKELCENIKDKIVFSAWTDNEGNRVKILLHKESVIGFRVERPDGSVMNGADAIKFAGRLSTRLWRIYVYSVPPELAEQILAQPKG